MDSGRGILREASCGGILRDHKGELCGILHGICMIRERGYYDIEAQSDSEEPIRLIEEHDCFQIIRAIREHCDHLMKVVYKHGLIN